MHTVFFIPRNDVLTIKFGKKKYDHCHYIPFHTLRKLIFLLTDSNLSRLVAEGYSLACFEPRILELIDEDRDAHALAKKKVRIADREWLMSRWSPLPGFEIGFNEGWADDLELATGRPRMTADLVLIFV